MPSRFATIDIGTNSVLLLAAERRADGKFLPLAERMEITRLGRGVDRTGLLAEDALAETLAAVEAFAKEARTLGCEGVAATATSAARDARNGGELVTRAEKFGVPVEIIGGEREAQLSWAAVAADFAVPGRTLAMIDIGGGSTEVVVGKGDQLAFRHSFDIGSVRLTERHLRSDPASPLDLAELDGALDGELSRAPVVENARVVGIAGTFTTLAAVALELDAYDPLRVHGLELPLSELESLRDRLAAMPLEARQRLPGMVPKRADLIVAGARIAAATVRRLGAGTVTIGDRGVRWGYLYDRFGG